MGSYSVLRLCFTRCCCVQPCCRDNRRLLLSVGFQRTWLTPSPRRTLTINGPSIRVCVLRSSQEHTDVSDSEFGAQWTLVKSKIPPAEDEEGVHLWVHLRASFTSHHLISCSPTPPPPYSTNHGGCIDPKYQYSKFPQSNKATCTCAQGLHSITASLFYNLSASPMHEITLFTQ